MKLGKLDWVLIGTAMFATWLAYHAAGDQPQEATLNLASGYAMSVFFYFLLVLVPETAKRRRIRTNLVRHYREFKVEVVGLLLHASKKGWTDDERRALAEPAAFTAYFSEDESGNGMRWYDVLNGLDEYYVGELYMRLELLRDEVQYVLGSIDIKDEELYLFLKRLSEIIYRMRRAGSDYDGVKIWGRFLWERLSNWSPVDGYLKDDMTLKMFQRI